MNHTQAIRVFIFCLISFSLIGCAVDKRKFELPHPEVKDISQDVIHEVFDDFEVYRFTGCVPYPLYDIAASNCDVWVSSTGGLRRLMIGDNRWLFYGREAGLEGDLVKRIALWEDKLLADVWTLPRRFFTKDLATFLFDPQTLKWTRLMENVGSSFEIDNGTLLYSPRRYPAGLELRDLVLGHTESFTTRNSALLDNHVMGAAVDGDKIWIASIGRHSLARDGFIGGGVTCLEPKTRNGVAFTTFDGLSHGYCSAIATDGKRVWIAHWHARRGLSVYDIETGKWSVVHDSANGITDIGGVFLFMRGKDLFIGQQGGLVILDTESMNARRYTTEDGLPGFIVSGITENDDSVWVSLYSHGRSSGVAVFRQ